MQCVGHHLQIYAHNNAGPDRDLFARSAYNRYYYGCFLMLREAFREMDSAWIHSPHKSYPEILSGQITRRLKHERRAAQKLGDTDLTKTIDSALRAIPKICEIIKEAYATRVVADYEPSIQVCFRGENRFSLNDIEISKAHQWQNRMQILISAVLTAWRQVNA